MADIQAIPLNQGKVVDTEMDLDLKLPYSKNKHLTKKRSEVMDADQRMSKNNFDVAESYGLISKREVLKSNYGLTERVAEDKIGKGEELKKHGKSKSLLSRYASSKIDKNSIDFDDIQPIKAGEGGFINIG
jgi:hypothetical protein